MTFDMQRDTTIDFTRAVAIIIIVTCHFLHFGGLGYLSSLGGYMGYVGNFIFFAISAILFGLKYEQKGASAFETMPFMKKRLVRLFASLWPFLTVILSIYAYIGVEFSPIKAAMNFMGLCWFAKLPNIGHLWFVTMIVLCYLMYVSVCKTQIISKLNRWGVVYVAYTLHNSTDDFGQI